MITLGAILKYHFICTVFWIIGISIWLFSISGPVLPIPAMIVLIILTTGGHSVRLPKLYKSEEPISFKVSLVFFAISYFSYCIYVIYKFLV